jgi:hypothetical protein
MKRDIALLRKILEAVEAGPWRPEKLQIDGHSFEEMSFHVWLLRNAGYLMASESAGNLPGEGKGAAKIECLTWAGYDYLDRLRKDSASGR